MAATSPSILHAAHFDWLTTGTGFTGEKFDERPRDTFEFLVRVRASVTHQRRRVRTAVCSPMRGGQAMTQPQVVNSLSRSPLRVVDRSGPAERALRRSDAVTEAVDRHASVPKPKLLDQVRDAIRARHMSPRTEEAYVHWIKRYVLYHHKRHPAEMGPAEITRFLTALAVERRVSASTQNQALAALLFLYREVYGIALPPTCLPPGMTFGWSKNCSGTRM